MDKKAIILIGILFLAIPLACTLGTGKLSKERTQIILEAAVPVSQPVSAADMIAARNIIENRVNGQGIKGAEVTEDGERRIVVTLPGVKDPDQVIKILYPTALLEFVDMSSITYQQALALQNAGTPIVTDLYQTEPVSTTQQVWHTIMTGKDIQNASVGVQAGRYNIYFELTSAGTVIFANFTSSHIGKVLTIALDKKIITAPTINDTIADGKGIINGNFTAESANALAVQLRYGALPVPLRVVETKVLTPAP